MNGAAVIAAFAVRESLRRRVFSVVGLLTLAFLALYGLGTWQLFDSVGEFEAPIEGVEARTVAGATILGLAMFATLFLGTILAVFLTLGAVRGDAERGLLQPVLVRPVQRRTVLAGRFMGGSSIAGSTDQPEPHQSRNLPTIHPIALATAAGGPVHRPHDRRTRPQGAAVPAGPGSDRAACDPRPARRGAGPARRCCRRHRRGRQRRRSPEPAAGWSGAS